MFRTSIVLFLWIAATTAALHGQDYWPLEKGSRWNLVSQPSGASMFFEVTDVDNDIYFVRWENPWIKATLGFRKGDEEIFLESLDMGSGVAPMPDGTVYFDFKLEPKQEWRNALGTMRILKRGSDVSTPSGKYGDSIQIRARDQKKTDTFWTFSPGVGIVQFGEGKQAFFLTSYTRGESAAGRTAPLAAPPLRSRNRAEAASAVWRRQGTPFVGIDANPSAKDGYSNEAKRRSAREAYQGGANLIYISPKWDEVEPSAGRFDFGEVDFRLGRAEEYDWPVAINLRMIDTHRRAMPSEYTRWSFDDPRMVEKLTDVIRRLGEREGADRVRWVTIGNEVNDYFKKNRREIPKYAALLETVTDDVKRAFPDAGLSVNFTWYAIMEMDQYRPLTDLVDFFSVTYYPLGADFSMRSPSKAKEDIGNILGAARGKQVFFQEVGYASASRLKSSEKAQAQFIDAVIDELERDSRIIAMNFIWMSDLPDSVLDNLVRYYDAESSANFRAFLGTLGYFDKDGRPKQAWQTFKERVSRISASDQASRKRP